MLGYYVGCWSFVTCEGQWCFIKSSKAVSYLNFHLLHTQKLVRANIQGILLLSLLMILSLLSHVNTNHGPVVADFIQWCNSSFLNINVVKPKELIVDLSKSPAPISPVVTDGQDVEVVKQ